MQVWSVGHSTHPLEDFVSLLASNGIELLADVRAVPKSLRHPHFHTDSLATALPAEGIAYEHLRALGGWRRSSVDSVNAGWRTKSFRAYADYTHTDDFARALEELRDLAAPRRTAIMCSETLWWRCHRRLIADRLVAEGDTVLHIDSTGRTAPHALPSFAVVGDDGRVTYPG